MQRSLKAAQAVQNGLNATGRKKDWGLDKWPIKGVTETNPFVEDMRGMWGQKKSKSYDIPVEFELVNQQGMVIGKQTTELNPSISIFSSFVVGFNRNKSSTLTFKEVNANEISDKLTIRVASVNGKPPETAKFPITAISTKDSEGYRFNITFLATATILSERRLATFTDSRDGRKYKAVEIGFQTWMAENLNYNAKGSVCYENKPANCQKYGRLYDWEAAMKACPKGWHLPTDEEWGTLTAVIGSEKKVGKDLMAESSGGTDVYDFSALPGGSGGVLYGGSGRSRSIVFEKVGQQGYWWTAKDGKVGGGFDTRVNYDYALVYNYYGSDHFSKDRLVSVRCVQDY